MLCYAYTRVLLRYIIFFFGIFKYLLMCQELFIENSSSEIKFF